MKEASFYAKKIASLDHGVRLPSFVIQAGRLMWLLFPLLVILCSTVSVLAGIFSDHATYYSLPFEAFTVIFAIVMFLIYIFDRPFRLKLIVPKIIRTFFALLPVAVLAYVLSPAIRKPAIESPLLSYKGVSIFYDAIIACVFHFIGLVLAGYLGISLYRSIHSEASLDDTALIPHYIWAVRNLRKSERHFHDLIDHGQEKIRHVFVEPRLPLATPETYMSATFLVFLLLSLVTIGWELNSLGEGATLLAIHLLLFLLMASFFIYPGLRWKLRFLSLPLMSGIILISLFPFAPIAPLSILNKLSMLTFVGLCYFIWRDFTALLTRRYLIVTDKRVLVVSILSDRMSSVTSLDTKSSPTVKSRGDCYEIHFRDQNGDDLMFCLAGNAEVHNLIEAGPGSFSSLDKRRPKSAIDYRPLPVAFTIIAALALNLYGLFTLGLGAVASASSTNRAPDIIAARRVFNQNRELTRLFPYSMTCHMYLFKVAAELEQFDTAIKAYKRAMSLGLGLEEAQDLAKEMHAELLLKMTEIGKDIREKVSSLKTPDSQPPKAFLEREYARRYMQAAAQVGCLNHGYRVAGRHLQRAVDLAGTHALPYRIELAHCMTGTGDYSFVGGDRFLPQSREWNNMARELVYSLEGKISTEEFNEMKSCF